MDPKAKRLAWNVFVYTALTLVTLFFLLPLLWILRTSLITKVEAYRIPPNWLPQYTLENYMEIFRDGEFARYFMNSFGISLIATVISVLLGAMASYWIARCSVRTNAVKISILLTQMIPPVVMVIPLSLIVKRLKLDDTWAALIISYLTFNLPYVIWMLIGFFESIPRELDEAGQIDGCSRIQVYVRIVLPLTMPGIMATSVYSFIVSWNEFMFALNLTGLKARTLPVAIANMETQQGVMIARLCASVMIAILPITVLSLFIKKYLVSGLTFGSVK